MESSNGEVDEGEEDEENSEEEGRKAEGQQEAKQEKEPSVKGEPCVQATKIKRELFRDFSGVVAAPLEPTTPNAKLGRPSPSGTPTPTATLPSGFDVAEEDGSRTKSVGHWLTVLNVGEILGGKKVATEVNFAKACVDRLTRESRDIEAGFAEHGVAMIDSSVFQTQEGGRDSRPRGFVFHLWPFSVCWPWLWLVVALLLCSWGLEGGVSLWLCALRVA